MKSVLIRNNFLFFMFFVILGCDNTKKTANVIYDTKKGIYFEYPYIEKTYYIFEKNNFEIELDKVFTENDIFYQLGIEKNGIRNIRIPIYREVSDFNPIIEMYLDKEIEKNYYKTPVNSFVVKFEYGTGHIRWNYLYVLKNNQLVLQDIFYFSFLKKESQLSLIEQPIKINLTNLEDSLRKIQ